MKWVPVLLGLFVCLVGCGVTNPTAPTLSRTSTSNVPTTYDMLEWMTMRSDMSAAHHMAGTANPLYTSVTSDRFYWTKTGGGYPWDIQLYDNDYIYLWVTELDWQNPRTFKAFKSSKLGKFNLPLAPRFASAGYPGSSIKISDSTYEIHSDCDSFVTKDLGHVTTRSGDPTKNRLAGSFQRTCKR